MVTTWGYNLKKGVNTSVSYSDSTPGIQYAYNCLNQLTQVTDASGFRTITYTPYNEPDTDSITIGGASCQLQENYDAYGRSSGYTLKQGTDVLQEASQGYEANGRLAGAGIMHEGTEQSFAYGYLAGSSLPSSLAMPNGIVRELAYEEHRDLAVAISCRLGETALVSRSQSYEALGRPVTRTQQRGTEATRTDSFNYNGRNELTGATLGTAPYGYSYDNIGNRKTARELAEELTYAANNLNQYTSIEENAEAPFVPTYDASGNQTLIKTSTGIWTVVYNAANRAVSFTSRDGSTVVECGYDYQGRRYMKKVTVNGTVASHERYLYRGYLQIAALDMLNSRNVLRTLLWDPLEPMATRPLALVQDTSLYCYGWDFNKNVTEVFDARGTIAATYDYSPYGTVTGTGSLVQPVQWSSEMNDGKLALVYYNYRYYNPADGRWINRDPIAEEGGWNLYGFVDNEVVFSIDYLGKETNEFGYTMTIPAGYIPILLIIEGSISIEKKKNCVCIEAKLRTDVGIGVGIGLKIKQKWLPILPDIEYSLRTMVAGLSNEKILKIDNCNGKTSTSYREELLGLSHRIDAGITLSSYIQASYSIDFKISAGLTLNAKPISLTLDATGYVKIAATLKIPFVIDQTEEIANKSFNENKKIWSK